MRLIIEIDDLPEAALKYYPEEVQTQRAAREFDLQQMDNGEFGLDEYLEGLLDGGAIMTCKLVDDE